MTLPKITKAEAEELTARQQIPGQDSTCLICGAPAPWIEVKAPGSSVALGNWHCSLHKKAPLMKNALGVIQWHLKEPNDATLKRIGEILKAVASATPCESMADPEAEIARLRQDKAKLAQWLGVTLDTVDYTSGACTVTEMVGAVLPKDVIENARAALAKAARQQEITP